MAQFDDRREAQENKWAHDQEARFRTIGRRNKLLGQWAAEKLGKAGPEVETYVASVMRSDLEEAGDADVIRKLMADFGAAKLTVNEGEIEQAIVRFTAQAQDQTKI